MDSVVKRGFLVEIVIEARLRTWNTPRDKAFLAMAMVHLGLRCAMKSSGKARHPLVVWRGLFVLHWEYARELIIKLYEHL